MAILPPSSTGLSKFQSSLRIVIDRVQTAAANLWLAVTDLFIAAFGDHVDELKRLFRGGALDAQLRLAELERDKLFREPVRLQLPASQRPRRVGRAASLSGAWRLAAC